MIYMSISCLCAWFVSRLLTVTDCHMPARITRLCLKWILFSYPSACSTGRIAPKQTDGQHYKPGNQQQVTKIWKPGLQSYIIILTHQSILRTWKKSAHQDAMRMRTGVLSWYIGHPLPRFLGGLSATDLVGICLEIRLHHAATWQHAVAGSVSVADFTSQPSSSHFSQDMSWLSKSPAPLHPKTGFWGYLRAQTLPFGNLQN